MLIITGGAGFIGSALIWKLNMLGVNDIWIVDNLGKSEKWKNLVNRRYRKYQNRDEFLRLLQTPGAMPRNIDAIIHLGACSSTTENDADYLMRNNVDYSIEACKFAVKYGIRFINASSAATYGDGSQGYGTDELATRKLAPLNMYGYSKHLFDLWLLDSGMSEKCASLKFFNVYGPNEYHKGEMRSMVCKAFREISESGRLRLFKSDDPAIADGDQKRDFIYVKDCVNYIAHFLANPSLNGIFNIGSGVARSFNDLAQAVFKAMKKPPRIEYVDMPQKLRGKYQNYTCADMGWRDCGAPLFAPLSLEEGVSDYVNNYLMRQEAHLEMAPLAVCKG